MAEYTIDQVMAGMPEAFRADKAGGIVATVQFHFTGDQAADWVLEIDKGSCSTARGTTDHPNVTMTVDSGDFLDLLAGRLEPMAAFMRGKLQMRGDVSLAMKLPNLFERP